MTSLDLNAAIHRRSLLAGSLTIGAASLAAPRIAFAQGTGPKNMLFVLLRGAMDGMAMLAPLGDPDYAALRPAALPDYEGASRLDSTFALHPAFAEIGASYAAGEALFVHATATSYRERSHFDGQDLLESGAAQPNTMRNGWLNRLVALLSDGDTPRALAIAPTMPLALRGSAPVSSYAPSSLPEASADFLDRVARLYSADEQLGSLYAQALETRAMAADDGLRNLRDAKKAGELAGSLMRGEDGARIAMIEMGGWDTHANQRGAFARPARNLDALLGAYATSMGSDWSNTLVLVATEFGRTARYNGTNGTDHGTASAALVMGGAVRGKRVLGDWPGLAERNLYQARDLMPTTALESVLAGAAAEHFGLDPANAMASLFPGRSASAMSGLIRA
ncbi:MAG: DUF1501 domain-containing protein [Pseudomonadota bacterium]